MHWRVSIFPIRLSYLLGGRKEEPRESRVLEVKLGKGFPDSGSRWWGGHEEGEAVSMDYSFNSVNGKGRAGHPEE